jgi:hypothetical protein
MRTFFFHALATICLGVSAHANPVNLDASLNSIGAADPHGNLRIWRELGDVDFGEGLVLPLRAQFSSANHGDSPYAGSGWWIPLLEANAFLKREKMMQATLLCGKTIYLRRDRSDPNKFQTLDKEWIGEINGDETTISRKDGWSLLFRHGQIQQMRTDTGRVLSWIWTGKVVTQIREQGQAAVPLQLQTSVGGVPNGFMVNGQRHGFALAERARVESVGGQTLVGGMDPSLVSWTWPNGKSETFRFEVEKDPGGLIPNLDITDREGEVASYTWDPSTGKVLTGEDWTYKVGSTKGVYELPRIERKNTAGESEFIHVNNAKGITEVKTLVGGHRIIEVFISPGPLYRKVRKIEITNERGEKRIQYAAAYDEMGRLKRSTDSKGFTQVMKYGDDGKLISQRVFLPDDANFLSQLKNQEQMLLKAVANISDEALKNEALFKLGAFYGKNQDQESAAKLLNQITERPVQFNLKLNLLMDNRNMTPSEKIGGLRTLLDNYPEKTSTIEALIAGFLNQNN